MVAHARVPSRIELLKNRFFCMIRGSYVPNLVKIGPQITVTLLSTDAGRTDGRGRDVLFNAMRCIGQTEREA